MFKKLLFLIVTALIYLHFYPEPAVNEWYEEKVESLKVTLDGLTSTSASLKSDVIYKDLLPEFASFSSEEKLHLKELTLTSSSVKKYYNKYCRGKKEQDFLFHTSNQTKVCATIERYSGLL